jgi:hypothetical protein
MKVSERSQFNAPAYFSVPSPLEQVAKVTDCFTKPGLAAYRDFQKTTKANPGALSNPVEFATAYAHACQVGAAAAFWCIGALFNVPNRLLGEPPETVR